MIPNALEIAGLTKTYGKRDALRDVSFGVPAGAFCCLVGPSGCGKTTLLRLIAGLDAPTRGAISIDGADATALSPAERGIGMVFQSYALFPNLTAAENVAFALTGKTWPAAKRLARTEEMLALVGLADFAKRRPAQMSGGQQQRVALARALAPTPRLLLLDEPLSALDPHVRASLRAELKNVQRRFGVTTIMVTHDREEALALSDSLVVLRAGALEQAAAPRTLFTDPASAFVADFVVGMNVIAATSTGEASALIGAARIETPPHGAPVGAALSLAVASGDIAVSREAEPGLPAEARAIEFAGATQTLIARLDATGQDLRIAVAVNASFAVGERLTLSFAPAAIRCYPA